MRAIGTVLAAMLLGVWGLAGCTGEESSKDSAIGPPTESVQATPTSLTCRTNERVGTPGGYWAHLPDGYPTREKAVAAWLSSWLSSRHFGSDFAVTSDGKSAWILRADGTAMAKVHFLRHSGYTVHGYEACAQTV
jgi:hypothetical protein